MKEMHRLLTHAVVLLLLVAMLNGSIAGQVLRKKDAKKAAISTTAAEKTERILTPDQQSAISQLDHLAEIIKDFEDDAFKIKLQAQVADALWDYHESRARQLFKAVFHDIDSLHTAESNPDKDPRPPGGNTQTLFQRHQLRNKVLS